jgi:hypothetical protein
MMEALSSSETPVLTRATRSNIPEDGILHAKLIFSKCGTIPVFENWSNIGIERRRNYGMLAALESRRVCLFVCSQILKD